MIKTSRELIELLRDCHVQSGYDDVRGRRRRAPVDALLVLLRSLGVDIDRPDQAGDILRARRRDRLCCGMEPVLIAWDGRLKPVEFTLPAAVSGSLVYELQAGESFLEGKAEIEDLDVVLGPDDATFEFVTHRLRIRGQIPFGYHRLHVTAGGKTYHSLVISSPRRAYIHGEGELAEPALAESNGRERIYTDAMKPKRAWGCFLPLYALRSGHDWGAGDFSSLTSLARWTGKLGGSAVGTLPLLAATLDEPFETSPYRPVSREFWNEFYIDIEAIPELRHNQACRDLIDGIDFRRAIEALKAADLVDYREVMRLKRKALTLLARDFFDNQSERLGEFQEFLAANSRLNDYARFRAAMDRRKTNWQQWPASMHERIADSEFDRGDLEYHLFSQWTAEQQLESLERSAGEDGCGLYLDLPVGVDPSGYDVWRDQSLYISGASTGSPPDEVFTRGQDWGLLPLHPDRIREAEYAPLRRVLERNMKFARYLRIDHAMGWHRLFCIAQGLGADEGAYIRYRADEIYAVASLESHRHQCALLAENMGTVPPEVNRRLERHGIGGMWVAPYELEPSRRHALKPPAPLSVASLNTHDMPPAAAWWNADDIADRRELGLIDDKQADAERADRQQAAEMLRESLRASGALTLGEEDDPTPVPALLRSLAASPAQLVLVTLEDLWLESRPQNVPGTSTERPNWQRKARYTLEEFMHLPEVLDVLSQVNALRHRPGKPR